MALDPIVSFEKWDPATGTLTPVTVKYLNNPTTEVAAQSWEHYAPGDVRELSAPQSLTLTPGNTTIAGTFAAPLYNGGSSILGYTLVWTPTGGTATTVNLAATATSFSLTSLTNGTAVSTVLNAYTALTNPGPTVTASATPSGTATAPGPPTLVTGTAGDGTATESWAAPADDGGSAITGYGVQRGSQTATTVSASTFSQMYSGLTNGTAYTLKVWAINAIGNSSVVSTSVTPTAATSLAAGHVPGTVMLGFASPDSTPRPGFPEARKIVCYNQGGTLVRDVWLKRSFVPSQISTSTINTLMGKGDPYGLYNVISFKYTIGSPPHEDWPGVTAGNYDSDLQVLADYAKRRRTTFPTGANKYFASGIHHEPAGNEHAPDTLATWADMQLYCSRFFAGWRRTGPSAAYVYDATEDVRDIMAWVAIGNGNWWSPLDQTSISRAFPDSLVAQFKAYKHIVAADFYEPTGSGLTNASGYADVGWVPARPANGKVELRVGNFIADMKGRPGGCGALGIGEYNSVAQTGIDNAYNVMKNNVDVFMFANYFNSASGSKWEYRLIPNSYPQISKIALAEYPPGVEVGGTWMTEQKLNVWKKNLDDSLGLDSTDATRMTQWTGWP